MSFLVKFEAYDPDATTYTLYDATSPPALTEPVLMAGADWGNAVWVQQQSGPRGTLGRRVAAQQLQDRVVSLPIRVYGTSMDDLAASLSDLGRVIELIRRNGGRIVRRQGGQTYRQYLEVLGTPGLATTGSWKTADTRYRMDCVFAATCAPYALGDPMDITDGFDSDTSSDYTADAGALSNVSITGGVMDAAANLSTENRLVHTGVGYTYGDHQATLKFTPGSTITSFKAGVILKRIDASNYLEVYVDDTGAASRLRVDKVVAGVRTNLQSSNLVARVSNGTPGWVRGRIEGHVIHSEYFTFRPNAYVTPTLSGTAHTMSTAEATTFGILVEGGAGIVWTPQQTAATLDDFEVEAFTYRRLSAPVPGGYLSPAGQVPGDVSGLVDVRFTGQPASQYFAWGGVTERPRTHNMLWNGDFENATWLTKGWVVSAVTNITAAATSITRVTTQAKYGSASGQVTAISGNADSGAAFRVWRRFRRGVTYTASAWVRAATSTQNVAVKVGNSAAADTATGSNVALSTSWQQATVTWTPAADYDDAYLGVIRRTAGAADVLEIDGVQWYEGTTAPTLRSQSDGRGGPPPFGVLEAEQFMWNSGATLSVTANGSASAGNVAGFTANGSAQTIDFGVVVDPNLLVPDDASEGTVTVEFFARFLRDTDTVRSCALWKMPFDLPGTTYQSYGEHGADGVTFGDDTTDNVFRLERLGTLTFPVDVDNPVRWVVGFDYSIDGVNLDAHGIDYLLCAPIRSRFVTPTGRDVPVWWPTVAVDQDRFVLSDGSGLVGFAAEKNSTPWASVGGRLLTVPAGRFVWAHKIADQIPGDSSMASASSETNALTTTVHFAITPRWAMLRDA